MTNEQKAADLISAFGEMAGMPFFKLDENNAAAARLEGGLRFEVEYLGASNRLFIYVVVGDGKLLAPEQAARQNVAIMAQTGFGLGLCDMQGEAGLILMASLDLTETDVERFGETAWRLVNAAKNLRQKCATAPETTSSPGSSAPGWLNV